jgi:hypothetical protein
MHVSLTCWLREMLVTSMTAEVIDCRCALLIVVLGFSVFIWKLGRIVVLDSVKSTARSTPFCGCVADTLLG